MKTLPFMTLRDVLGSVSAATLGYITNGFRGAKAGFRGYNSYQKNMKRKSVSTANFYGKATPYKRPKTTTTTIKTVRVNRKKPARRRLRAKGVKGCKSLGKCLKRQVRNIARNVVHKEHPIGRYHKSTLWTFPQVYGAGTAPLQNVVNSGLWGGSSGGFADANFSVGDYRKLVDALSVLFNSKVAALYTATGNITTSQMIIPEITHVATYEITNNTPHEQIFLMYETTPKDDTDSDIVAAWNAMSVPQEGGATRGITYFGMRPEMYPQFKDSYRILKKSTRVLKPGQRMTYSMKVTANHLRFDKWTKPGTTTQWFNHKGFTKELMIINWAKPIVGKITASTFTIAEWNCSDVAGYGIIIDMRDHFTIRCPENIVNTNVKDNALCVFSRYNGVLDPAVSTTVVKPAISVVAPAQ